MRRMTLIATIAALGAGLFAGAAQAQPAGCDQGVVRLPDSNGTVIICSALSAQVPQLSKQLADAGRTLGDQRVQIKELTRLVQGMNDASRNIGADRQMQMLKSLSAELARSQRGGDDRTRRTVETLTQQFDELRQQMTAALANQTTMAATQAGLRGDVGDSIAQLELASASRKLDDINTRLAALQGQVGDVKSDTSVMRQQLEKIVQQNEADAAQQAASMKKLEAIQRQSAERPDAVGHIYLLGPLRPGGPVSLNLTLARGAWRDARVLIVGRSAGSRGWVVDLSPQLEPRQVAGSQALHSPLPGGTSDLSVCLTVLDPVRGRPVTLSQAYSEPRAGALPGYHMLAPVRLDLDPPAECNAVGLERMSFSAGSAR